MDANRVFVGQSFPCFKSLAANDKDVFVATASLILRYANNILKDPENLKFRQIRLENQKFMDKILPVDGAFDTFFSMGFEEVRLGIDMVHYKYHLLTK